MVLPHKLIRLAAYGWAGINTCLGLAIGAALCGRFRLVQGVVEIHGPGVAWVLKRLWIPAAALTLGHCVLGQSEHSLRLTRQHERVHVRQYERWGPLFVPAYLLAAAWLFATGRDGYRENPFEREAYDYCKPH
jgi:hypothetical protein